MTTDELRGGDDCVFMWNPLEPGEKDPIPARASYKHKPKTETELLFFLFLYILLPHWHFQVSEAQSNKSDENVTLNYSTPPKIISASATRRCSESIFIRTQQQGSI